MATSFDTDAYEIIREGCKRSAQAVVPKFLFHYRPRTVYDMGGGEGFWAQAFRDHGCEALVLDGPDANPDVIVDLGEPLPEGFSSDLAVCLEVAEHLPASRADSFVADLCSLAPVVLFSAAIPGQGGIGHVNEQWPDYWVERFEANGFKCSGALRWRIWGDEQVENWYQQNIMVAVGKGEDIPSLFDYSRHTVAMFPVVHPILFDARRQ